MIGLKVSEYLASGLPIIINKKIKGIDSLMNKYNIGVYYDNNNITAMINGILSMHMSYKRYQIECLNVAEKYFNIKKASENYFSIYKKLINEIY